ncbi:hypothetical protein NUT31_12625 [Aeromonas sp. BC14]|nr:hypothetical protein [Aeromonas sp. BC14]WAF93254.1 hypothetical protein NUT31_12625 [Aeromonas sp. BC14]
MTTEACWQAGGADGGLEYAGATVPLYDATMAIHAEVAVTLVLA